MDAEFTDSPESNTSAAPHTASEKPHGRDTAHDITKCDVIKFAVRDDVITW